ncbi:unnamed protein product [Triticum turgidum subsp. durum]|uniref:Uncharacterized protein n=1 Tax=Triticum turgidum subsp. durum TaxID=4567 RepID=A0A9R0X1L4_TRITD|nr:unnamed protein product [Triticum turgidum subsp. durum]
MDRGGGRGGLLHPPDPRRPCPNPLRVRCTQPRPRSSRPTARSPSSCGSPPFLPSPPSRHASCLHLASLLPPQPLQEARPPCCKAAGPNLEEEEEIPGSRRWLGTVPFRYVLHGADGFHGAEESMRAFCWKGLGGWESSAMNDECWRSFYCDTTLSSFMRHGHSQRV